MGEYGFFTLKEVVSQLQSLKPCPNYTPVQLFMLHHSNRVQDQASDSNHLTYSVERLKQWVGGAGSLHL
jgi:hypothetical protein